MARRQDRGRSPTSCERTGIRLAHFGTLLICFPWPDAILLSQILYTIGSLMIMQCRSYVGHLKIEARPPRPVVTVSQTLFAETALEPPGDLGPSLISHLLLSPNYINVILLWIVSEGEWVIPQGAPLMVIGTLFKRSTSVGASVILPSSLLLEIWRFYFFDQSCIDDVKQGHRLVMERPRSSSECFVTTPEAYAEHLQRTHRTSANAALFAFVSFAFAVCCAYYFFFDQQ